MTSSSTEARPAAAEIFSRSVAGAQRPPAPGPLFACRTFAWRTLIKLKYVQDHLGTAVVFPVILTLVFTYLLGGAIAGSPREYLQFFLPGVIVLSLVASSMMSALTLNRDIATGMFDRVRSTPIWQPAVLVGTMGGDVLRYALTSVVPLALGLLLGFRPDGGFSGVLLALLYLQLFTFSVSWLWMFFAVLIPQPTAAAGIVNLLQFILLFGSNILAPQQTMPGWLEAVVKLNPVTHAATTTRGLMHGDLASGDLGAGLLACAVLVVLFAPPTVLLYSRKQR
ncbi:ABC transporter [Micromonospora craterilacus]|uniref:Transport permease protein n=1 Tax=Micromonospora craterilacus TaxID=1655439 RepID=A0A2W2FI83_9ACTN|nr:ABC transporter permease [Micromonospora craterilacus]PZG24368.1 ABC transporter [Micromonospora craterilacus]